jgi:hypothetical protein
MGSVATACTEEELFGIYVHGFTILRGIIPPALCAEAKRAVLEDAERATTSGAVLDLFRATPLMGKAISALGPRITGWAQPRNLSAHRNLGTAGMEFLEEVAPRGCQVAIVPPQHHAERGGVRTAGDGERIGINGWRAKDQPIFKELGGPWQAHLDGVWSGGAPPLQSRDADTHDWYHGPPSNGCPGPHDLHPNPGMRHINWTALVGVALTDQTLPGSGALGVLDGMHTEMAAFFRRQQAAGGPIGPGGPQWPRENYDAENGHGLYMVPPFLSNATRHGSIAGPGGLKFPRPTLVNLAVGDAVICHHLIPHSPTQNNGPEPRIQVYFRLVRTDRPDGCAKAFPAAEMDPLLEWNGVREAVMRRRGQVAAKL